MSHVIYDATSAMHDTYDETTSVRDTTLPLGEFLDEQLARVRGNENTEDAIIDDSDDENSPNDYELLVVPEGYVMNEEAARAIFVCNDRYDLKCNIPNFQFGMLYIRSSCISYFLAFC